MAYQLRYKYAKGDVLVYDIYVTQEIREPEGESLQTLMAIRSTTLVEFADLDLFFCRVHTEVVDAEGLAALAPAIQNPEPMRYSHDERGRSREVAGGSETQSSMVFPEEPMSAGDSWDYVEGLSEQSTRFRVQLDEILEQDGEQIAVLSSNADLPTGEAGSLSSLHSVFHFSITRGRRLWSRTAIENQWASGRKMTSMIEVHADSESSC
jgi:hypothetical protein